VLTVYPVLVVTRDAEAVPGRQGYQAYRAVLVVEVDQAQTDSRV
jgi:hypothetical protein